MRDLPELESLRVFEYAARSLSFKHAAQQLHLTPPAVSHRIRSLERELGMKLFIRLPRAVKLSAEGAALYDAVTLAFGSLREQIGRIAGDRSALVLTISAPPAFISGWLMPRLADLQDCHPELQVRLETSLALVDFDRSDVDVAIRFTAWPARTGLITHWLLPGEAVVVCTPQIAQRLHHPSDLVKATLLHSTTSHGNWAAWLEAAGLDAGLARQGPRFDNDTLALEAARNGLGVAILHHSLVRPHIARGDLVRPFTSALAAEHGYYLVYPERLADKPSVNAFRAWILRALGR